MKIYTLTVAAVKRETSDTITLCFKQPGLKKIKYLAGQYLAFIFRINGRRYIRPYSFSSCPDLDTYLEVTIKRVLNGIVSNHIHDIVKEGDVIEVMQPMGDFIYKPYVNVDNVYLWGVGSGITPLMSLAKHILNTTDISVNLIYGNRNKESTIFHGKILKLRQTYPDRFIAIHFYTKLVVDDVNPAVVSGRIDQMQVLNTLAQNKNLSSSLHYICGPAGLKESVKKALKIKNIEDNKIFVEDFELTKDPKDFEEINTQNVQLRFENNLYSLEVVKGKSILEAALDSGIELPYSCQTGNCNTCKGTLFRGMAKMIGIEQRSDLLMNEFLLCCSHPLSDDVYLEIN